MFYRNQDAPEYLTLLHTLYWYQFFLNRCFALAGYCVLDWWKRLFHYWWNVQISWRPARPKIVEWWDKIDPWLDHGQAKVFGGNRRKQGTHFHIFDDGRLGWQNHKTDCLQQWWILVTDLRWELPTGWEWELLIAALEHWCSPPQQQPIMPYSARSCSVVFSVCTCGPECESWTCSSGPGFQGVFRKAVPSLYLDQLLRKYTVCCIWSRNIFMHLWLTSKYKGRK